VGPRETLLGLKGAPNAGLAFEDCRIPKENLIGQEDDGLKIAFSSLDVTRLECAALALGVSQAALDASIAYSKQRVQFGQPIANFQAIQWMIADMATELDAARLLTYRAAFVKDEVSLKGGRYTKEAAMAKRFAADMAMKHATDAVQIHGGYGYTKNYPVERLFRDAKLLQIWDGTTEIQRMVIARSLLE